MNKKQTALKELAAAMKRESAKASQRFAQIDATLKAGLAELGARAETARQHAQASAEGGRKRRGKEDWHTTAVRVLIREVARPRATHGQVFTELIEAAEFDDGSLERALDLAGMKDVRIELDDGRLILSRDGRIPVTVTKKVIERIRATKTK